MADDIKVESPSENEGIFNVEYIAAEKQQEDGPRFLCKWVGYPWSEYV